MTEMSKLIIAPANADDVSVIADLSSRTFLSAYRSMLPLEALRDFVVSAFSEDKIREEMGFSGSRFLLAYAREKPVGYAFLREAGPPIGLTVGNPIELARIYFDEQAIG